MKTLIVIFFLVYIYTVLNIRQKDGSWKDFNPVHHTFIEFIIFIIGTVEIIALIGYVSIKYLP